MKVPAFYNNQNGQNQLENRLGDLIRDKLSCLNLLERSGKIPDSGMHQQESHSTSIPLCRSVRNYATDLTLVEHELIAEVQQGMAVFQDERLLPCVGEFTELGQIMNWQPLYGRHIMQFCNSIRAFQLLTYAQKRAALKPFYVEILCFRFASMYDFERNGYYVIAVGVNYCGGVIHKTCNSILPQNDSSNETLFINFDILNKMQPKNQKIVKEHLTYFLTLNEEMENDDKIRDLLIVRFLFKPREEMSNSEFVR